MSHRIVLTARQRAALFDLPTDEASLLRHYTLADDDIAHVRTRRRPENQMGFALQLCAFRHPGRLLRSGEVIPEAVSRFIGAQLGLQSDDLLPYAARENTRLEHLAALRKIYGYKMFTGKRAQQMRCFCNGRQLVNPQSLSSDPFRRCRASVRGQLMAAYLMGSDKEQAGLSGNTWSSCDARFHIYVLA